MKNKIAKFLKHELIRGSAFVFAGSLFSNFFNYLFHLITGRMLGPERYAIVASLISLLYVISFPSGIIAAVTTRKMASLFAKKDFAAIKGVFKFLLKKVFYLNLMIVFSFLIFQDAIADFLKIENSFLVFLLGMSFVLSLFSIVSLATLQGLFKFLSFSLVNTLSSVLRDVFAFLAIVFNFGVLGVMWGMVLTGFIGFLFSFYPLRPLFSFKEKVHRAHFQSYFSTFWVAAALLGIGLMLNSDVILVKHFFPEFEAGLYAALATMGKVVFFASSSIGTVLLPLATKKKESGVSPKKELLFAQTLVFLMSFAIFIFYLLFPKFTVKLFYGESYLLVAPYLWLIALYFLFYNLSYLFVNFFISLRGEKILLLPSFFAVLQIGLIFVFHNSFYQVISILILTASLLFLSFLIYYLRHEKIKITLAFGHRSLL